MTITSDEVGPYNREAVAHTIGPRLRKARNAMRMSIRDVAGAVGLTPGAIIGYEHGTRLVPIPMLLTLADLYETGVATLLGLSGSREYNAGYLEGWRACRTQAFTSTDNAFTPATSAVGADPAQAAPGGDPA